MLRFVGKSRKRADILIFEESQSSNSKLVVNDPGFLFSSILSCRKKLHQDWPAHESAVHNGKLKLRVLESVYQDITVQQGKFKDNPLEKHNWIPAQDNEFV